MFTTRSHNPVHAPRWGLALVILVLGTACGLALSACGNNGNENSALISSGNGGAATVSQGISYNYPYNNQKDVPRGALLRMVYDQTSNANAAAPTLSLVKANGYAVNTTTHVDHATVALQPDKPLAPRTQYIVQANGLALFAFTTAPDKSAPSKDGFKVVHVTPGDGIPFMTFSTLRIRFSEPVDPSTIKRGQGFIFQDSHGNPVPGNLYVQGNNLVFDPRVKPVSSQQRPAYACTHPHDVTRITCDLDPNKAYIFKLDPTKVKSIYGDALQASAESHFTIHPRAAGSATVTHLAIAHLQNGTTGNKVTVKSQLLGTNHLTIDPASADMVTVVSQQLVKAPALGGSVMPMVVRRGGGFAVSPLNVKFSGKIPAGITSGTLHNTFITDLDAYFVGSPYAGGPVTIRMNFDVAVYGDDAKGNGAVNQNVLNVTAVGTARSDDKGHLIIDAMGAFPVAVNAVDAAATNFRLHLAAPAQNVAGNNTPPTIIGQYPSACAYVYGTAFVWNGPFIYGDTKGSPWLDADGNVIPKDSMPAADVPGHGNQQVYFRVRTQWHPGLEPAVDATQQDCAGFLQDKHNGRYVLGDGPQASSDGNAFQGNLFTFESGVDGINDVLPEISPSVTFSKPVDPASLHNTNGVQLLDTTTNAPVPAALRVQGTTVVVDPDQPLDYNTEYTLSVGTGVTDLAGNALVSSRQIVFHTAPYVPPTDGPLVPPFFGPPGPYPNNIIETAPFLTTLYPGLPCALTGGNFKTGGDTAGYCTGSDQASSAPMRKWGVFKLPANRAVHMVFSKPVKSSSIVLANGCLTGTDGMATPASNGGSVAVQIMNSSGQCTGVVDAGVLLPHPGYPYTRALSIHPASPWQPGQRYWLVVCGSNNANATCVTGKTIVDVDNGKPATQREADNGYPTHDGRLNTDPMNGTGTNVLSTLGNVAAGYGTTALQQAAGGPDIVMPFDGAPASQDQFLIAQLKPFTDVNGNGFAGGAELAVLKSKNPDTFYDHKFFQILLAPDERERPTPMNQVLTRSVAVGYTYLAGAGLAQVVYNSGAQPSAVGDVRSAAACNAMMSADVQALVGTGHGQCAPITIYPGGLVAQTSAVTNNTAGYAPYGRTLLHTAGVPKDPNDPASPTVPQTGYIVDHCQGTYLRDSLPSNHHQGSAAPENTSFVAGTPTSYDYSPCFVVQQHFIFTADPQVSLGSFFDPTKRVIDELAPQEPLTVDLVGPVKFDRNGRLVIQATNVRGAMLKDTLAPLPGYPPNTVAIPAGRITVQLLGPVIHGGPLAAFKTQ